MSTPTLILLAFLAFVSLGLPDTLLGVAWPSIAGRFGRPIGDLGFVLAGTTVGYLAASFSGGWIVRRVGVGGLLVGSTFLVTLALLGTTCAFAWPMILACAVVAGLGAGAIDTGINLYAAARFSPRVVNWLHASWGIGATIGPLIMTLAIAGSLGGWRIGYLIVAVALGAMCWLFVRTRDAWSLHAPDKPETDEPSAGLFEAITHPVVLLQVIFYLVYGSVEAVGGAWQFTLFTRSRSIDDATAGTLVGLYWAMLTIGRIVFGQIATRMQRLTVLRVGLTIAMVATPFWLTLFDLPINAPAILLLGFGLAPLYPTLMSLTPSRVGVRFVHHAVAMQVAACALGIAVGPTLVGILQRWLGLEVIPVVLIVGVALLIVLHEAIVRLTRSVDVREGRGFAVQTPAAASTG